MKERIRCNQWLLTIASAKIEYSQSRRNPFPSDSLANNWQSGGWIPIIPPMKNQVGVNPLGLHPALVPGNCAGAQLLWPTSSHSTFPRIAKPIGSTIQRIQSNQPWLNTAWPTIWFCVLLSSYTYTLINVLEIWNKSFDINTIQCLLQLVYEIAMFADCNLFKWYKLPYFTPFILRIMC